MAKRKQFQQKDARTGRIYVYEASFEYDKSKKKTMLIDRRLVGHVDPESGDVVPNRTWNERRPSPQARRVFFGATYLLDGICQETGIAEDIKKAAPQLADAAMSLAYYLVVEDDTPMLRFNRFAKTHAHPYGGAISSQQSSEIFEELDEGVKERFCALRSARIGESGYWFYDTTSISSYSQRLRCVKWGRNKDRVPLAQLNLAVLLDDRSGMPFYIRRLPGNISDVSTIKKLVDDISFLDVSKARVACDRGFYSAKNINAMMASHMKFLIGVKCSHAFVSKALGENADVLRAWDNYDEDHAVFGLKVPIDWNFEMGHPRKGTTEKSKKRAYLHLYHSPERTAADEAELAALLKALSGELNADNRIEAHASLYDVYFKRERGGRYAGRMDVINEARSHFGYFALLGNDASLDSARALEIYRNKDAVEKAFDDVKNRLDFKTPKVSSELTLNGKLLVVLISLMIVSWLKKKMIESGLNKKWTMQGLIDEIDTIERYEREGRKPQVLEITDKQRKIFEALGINPPVTS
jgi:transposase